jgi:hypothetical protein
MSKRPPWDITATDADSEKVAAAQLPRSFGA